MREYLDAVRTVLNEGTRKENRTGVDTLSTFGVHYRANMDHGFPLLTTKRISWKNIVVENLWFLSGSHNIEFLRKHRCKFWDPWANAVGNVPSAYGHIWRQFPNRYETTNDQIRWVVQELIRNPMSRRLVVSAWDPNNAQTSRLPPCHLLFILNTQTTSDGPTLNLHLTQRSCDMALGVPYNLAGYGFLLQLFARFAGMRPGVFSHTLVDAHVYTAKPDGSMAEYDHIPGLQNQLKRGPRALPTLKIDDSIQTLRDVEAASLSPTDELLDIFKIENYTPANAIHFKVAV